jgi:hypothetical protein
MAIAYNPTNSMGQFDQIIVGPVINDNGVSKVTNPTYNISSDSNRNITKQTDAKAFKERTTADSVDESTTSQGAYIEKHVGATYTREVGASTQYDETIKITGTDTFYTRGMTQTGYNEKISVSTLQGSWTRDVSPWGPLNFGRLTTSSSFAIDWNNYINGSRLNVGAAGVNIHAKANGLALTGSLNAIEASGHANVLGINIRTHMFFGELNTFMRHKRSDIFNYEYHKKSGTFNNTTSLDSERGFLDRLARSSGDFRLNFAEAMRSAGTLVKKNILAEYYHTIRAGLFSKIRDVKVLRVVDRVRELTFRQKSPPPLTVNEVILPSPDDEIYNQNNAAFDALLDNLSFLKPLTRQYPNEKDTSHEGAYYLVHKAVENEEILECESEGFRALRWAWQQMAAEGVDPKEGNAFGSLQLKLASTSWSFPNLGLEKIKLENDIKKERAEIESENKKGDGKDVQLISACEAKIKIKTDNLEKLKEKEKEKSDKKESEIKKEDEGKKEEDKEKSDNEEQKRLELAKETYEKIKSTLEKKKTFFGQQEKSLKVFFPEAVGRIDENLNAVATEQKNMRQAETNLANFSVRDYFPLIGNRDKIAEGKEALQKAQDELYKLQTTAGHWNVSLDHTHVVDVRLSPEERTLPNEMIFGKHTSWMMGNRETFTSGNCIQVAPYFRFVAVKPEGDNVKDLLLGGNRGTSLIMQEKAISMVVEGTGLFQAKGQNVFIAGGGDFDDTALDSPIVPPENEGSMVLEAEF